METIIATLMFIALGLVFLVMFRDHYAEHPVYPFGAIFFVAASLATLGKLPALSGILLAVSFGFSFRGIATTAKPIK